MSCFFERKSDQNSTAICWQFWIVRIKLATVWIMKCIKLSMAWNTVQENKINELLFGTEIWSEFRLEFFHCHLLATPDQIGNDMIYDWWNIFKKRTLINFEKGIRSEFRFHLIDWQNFVRRTWNILSKIKCSKMK